jgi:hypothetical protein
LKAKVKQKQNIKPILGGDVQALNFLQDFSFPIIFVEVANVSITGVNEM